MRVRVSPPVLMTVALYFFCIFLFLIAATWSIRTFLQILNHEPPFVPISRSVVHVLRYAIQLPAGSVFYDLGSGDGRIVIAMAKEYPESTCIGIEKDLLAYCISRLRLIVSRTPNAHFLYGDMYSVSISDATHIYAYLFSQTINKLFPRITAECKPGTEIILCDFPFSALQPKSIETIGTGFKKHTLYTYFL